MKRARAWTTVGASVIGCLGLSLALGAQAPPADTNWPTYGADLRSTRYMPLEELLGGVIG